MDSFVKQVFDFPTPSGSLIIAIKSALIYVFLVVGLRLLGKRELGQMTVFDLVMIIVLGNAVQNAMMNGDNSLGGGIVASLVLLGLNRLLNAVLRRSKKIERFMVGEPLLLVNDGHVLQNNIDREGLTMEQLSAALREHGMDKLEDAHLMVLEVDGSISVIPATEARHRTRRHFKAVRLP